MKKQPNPFAAEMARIKARKMTRAERLAMSQRMHKAKAEKKKLACAGKLD